jgi:hypothetical protein
LSDVDERGPNAGAPDVNHASPFALADRATIVSGLPRSGTSLLMQILEAAGLLLARDDARPPDPDNPRGYHELAAVKRLRRDAGFLVACRGRVVKIVAPLLMDVPVASIGRVLFVERDLDEVLASQRTMLARRGEALGPTDEAALRRAFPASLDATRAWLARSGAPPVLFVEHRRLIEAPGESVARIAQFLERTAGGASAAADAAPPAVRERCVRAMAAVVDAALHRQRGAGCERARPAQPN